jgi:hypothetical protein
MNSNSISSKLQELFDLFNSGALTKEEYAILKSELLVGENTTKAEKIDTPELIAPTVQKEEKPSNDFDNTVDKTVKVRRKNIITILAIIGVVLIGVLLYFLLNRKERYWEEKNAKALTMQELANYDWSGNETWSPSAISHEVLGYKDFYFNNDSIKVGIIQHIHKMDNSDGNSCYSIFEFSKNNKWAISNRYIDIIKATETEGFLHQVNTDDIKRIGDNQYGLLVLTEEGATANINRTKSLFSFLNNQFEKMLSVTHKFNVMFDDNIDFTFNFLPKDKGYYEIESLDNEDYNSNRKVIYHFNGKEYVKENQKVENQQITDNSINQKVKEIIEKYYSVSIDRNYSELRNVFTDPIDSFFGASNYKVDDLIREQENYSQRFEFQSYSVDYNSLKITSDSSQDYYDVNYQLSIIVKNMKSGSRIKYHNSIRMKINSSSKIFYLTEKINSKEVLSD